MFPPIRSITLLNIHLSIFFRLLFSFGIRLLDFFFSGIVTPFNTEVTANVNYQSLTVAIKTVRLEFSKATTALDLCCDHLFGCPSFCVSTYTMMFPSCGECTDATRSLLCPLSLIQEDTVNGPALRF